MVESNPDITAIYDFMIDELIYTTDGTIFLSQDALDQQFLSDSDLLAKLKELQDTISKSRKATVEQQKMKLPRLYELKSCLVNLR